MYWRNLLIKYMVKHISTECSGHTSVTLNYNFISLILGVPSSISTTCQGIQTIY